MASLGAAVQVFFDSINAWAASFTAVQSST